MQSTQSSSAQQGDSSTSEAVGLVAVPAARLDVWETASREGGWLYGVETQGANGATSFAGMLWRQTRLRDDQITPVVAPTSAGRLGEVSPLARGPESSPLGPLAELALLKLAMVGTTLPRTSRIKFYVSAFQVSSTPQVHRDTLVKRSLASYQPGEDTQRPTAVDAQFALDDWEETIAFAHRHPKLVWLEDPIPIGKWPPCPACPVPLATGELAASVADVDAVLRFSVSTPLVLHLELSRLGPISLATCIHLARQKKTRVAFHGHLPLDTALVLRRLGIGGLVELNLSHFSERMPWPYAAQWISASAISRHCGVTASLLSRTLEARPPDSAMKRT